MVSHYIDLTDPDRGYTPNLGFLASISWTWSLPAWQSAEARPALDVDVESMQRGLCGLGPTPKFEKKIGSPMW